MIRLFSLSLLLVSVNVFAFETLQKIVFASCAKERMPQPIWLPIIQEQPDLFLFIGDNHYADWQMINGKLTLEPVTDKARFEEAYETLGEKTGYQILKANTPIMATWDDHDYGANDQGVNYPLKKESQQAFLDFFDFAQKNPIRQQAGIYHSQVFGPKGKRVQVIMLDTRYHRDDITPSDVKDKKYQPNPDNSLTVLGDAQWQWLEQQLTQPTEIRLIVSSIQMVAYEHGWESWGLFPAERQRMYDLIAKTKANGVFFISGDRHLTEISQDSGQAGNKVPYKMWDFTSSGMTDEERKIKEANKFRVGPVYRGTNFGVIEIEWADTINQTQIHFASKKLDGSLINRQTLFLEDLAN